MTVTIRHKRDFQTYMFRVVDKDRRNLLDRLPLEERLSTILRTCEFYTRGVYETDLPREYNPASHGLWWTVVRGTIDGETHITLKAMTFRQLCGVVYDLLHECGGDITTYAQWLMQHYGPGKECHEENHHRQ